MKRVFKFASSLLLITALLCSLGVVAFADSTITYNGSQQGFEIELDDDLFDSFKGVMPGDTLTETITIRNKYTAADNVLIYLRAVPHTEEEGPHVDEVAENEDYASMMDFLAQLTLKVEQDGGVISEDAADKPAGLAESQLIAQFRGKGSSEIQVTLQVPIDMGNEYAQRWGEIDWQFYAVEKEDPPTPSTGDNSKLMLFASLFCLSLAMSFVLISELNKSKY